MVFWSTHGSVRLKRLPIRRADSVCLEHQLGGAGCGYEKVYSQFINFPALTHTKPLCLLHLAGNKPLWYNCSIYCPYRPVQSSEGVRSFRQTMNNHQIPLCSSFYFSFPFFSAGCHRDEWADSIISAALASHCCPLWTIKSRSGFLGFVRTVRCLLIPHVCEPTAVILSPISSVSERQIDRCSTFLKATECFKSRVADANSQRNLQFIWKIPYRHNCG